MTSTLPTVAGAVVEEGEAVFVDTSAMYAVLRADDRAHAAAARAWAELVPSPARLVSSSYVVLETITLLQTRFGLEYVRRFARVFEPALDIVWVDGGIHGPAMSALLGAGERDVSLTDFSSFAVMVTHRIRTAFAFDRHFADRGFQLLPGRTPVA